MKFTYKLLSLGLAIACLSGCNAANTEIASSSAATATVDPATDSTEVPASNNVFTSAGDGLYVTTDSGIYELQTVFPDSANIFYTDANTKERIFLCANPNCTHADESCPSYIATPSAMFPPMLLRVGDQLLVVFTETTDSSNPHGMLMNMDGSNRRTVFELASNQYMQGGFCTSGNDLYFDLYEIDDSGNVTYQLWYVSFENGTSEKVMDLGSDSDHYSLCDGVNNELCFNHLSSDGISYCMYDPQSKTMSDPFFVDSSSSGNSMIQDGYLFVLDEQANSVQRIRLSDKEQASASFTVKEGFGTPSMRYLFDGNLMITEAQTLAADIPTDGSYDMCSYILDFDTRNCTEFTLQTPYNNRLYGLLGPNGAGKSTLIHIITGTLAPDSGEVLWCGKPASGIAFRRILGYMPQQQGLYDSYTGRRFLAYMAALKEIPRKTVASEVARVAAAVNLTAELDKRLSAYSGGMKQRLLLASALLGDPKLLILDEPTAGLDPKERVRLRELLADMAKDRIILVATHVVSDVETVATKVILLRAGKIVDAAPVPELIARYAPDQGLEDVYLNVFGERDGK